MRLVYLKAPVISADTIKQKITCIRAHRERIFLVTPQEYSDKIVFHNYGQGGAGWTFLFGCVHESLRQFETFVANRLPLKRKLITVLGAGCYGLLTAILLTYKGYTVQIIAKETELLSSYNAAGFFFPRPRKCSKPFEYTLFEAYGLESYQTYLKIINGTHPFIMQGASLLPAYFGLDMDPGFSPYIRQGLVKTPEPVMINFDTGKWYNVQEYYSLFINSHQLMNELHQSLNSLKIPLIKKEITSFAEINESIIFNCTGLGSRNLVQDRQLIPVQGHLIALKNQPAPEQLRYMINVKVTQNTLGRLRDELLYFAPKEEGILGITFIRGEDSLTANVHEFDRILTRAQEYFGML